jgi:pyruvate dehydrogenase E1 component beta subunit
MATPGLAVAAASTPQTAYGLLRSAIRADDPVVVLEPRALYGRRAEVNIGEDALIPIGKAEVVREGTDVTIVTLGSTRAIAEEAAELGEWSAEVVDLRTLIPWDKETVLSSAVRTKRVVTVEEAPFSGGWGTEISSVVAAELFGDLAAPVTRITCPDVPVPYPEELEQRYLPSAQYVTDQISELLHTGRLPKSWWDREGFA